MYYLRENWIFKGLAALIQAEVERSVENVFLRSDAAERFGIGPAMVQAMQFWLVACGLIDLPSRGAWDRSPHLTNLGRFIWRYDPYLERLDTIWLLHIHLVRNRLHASTWFWFFSSYASSEPFDELTCLEALYSWVIASSPEHIVKRTTYRRT